MLEQSLLKLTERMKRCLKYIFKKPKGVSLYFILKIKTVFICRLQAKSVVTEQKLMTHDKPKNGPYYIHFQILFFITDSNIKALHN